MYVSLLPYNTSRVNGRQYVQSQILCKLIKDKKYIFSISVLLNQVPLNSIGVYFDSVLLFQQKNSLIKKILQLESGTKHLKLKRKKWTNLKIEYVAKGFEKHLIIGNFQSDEENNYVASKKIDLGLDYKFGIDNISLQPVLLDTQCNCANEIYNHWDNYNYRHSNIQISDYHCSNPIYFSDIEDSILIETNKIDSINLDGNLLSNLILIV